MERQQGLASMSQIKEKKKRYERGAARAPAARLAARRVNRGEQPHLRVGGTFHYRTFCCFFAVLVSCVIRHAPSSPRSIGFCVIWDCISSSSSSPVYLKCQLPCEDLAGFISSLMMYKFLAVIKQTYRNVVVKSLLKH